MRGTMLGNCPGNINTVWLGTNWDSFLSLSHYISHVWLGMEWVIVISPELTYFSADKPDYQVYWSDLNSLLGWCARYSARCNVR